MAILVIFALPIIIVMKSEIRDIENPLIVKLQQKLFENEFWSVQAEIFSFITSISATLLYAVLLFMCNDAPLAFKTIILYCVGHYIQMIIAFILVEPRPFWVSNVIFAKNG